MGSNQVSKFPLNIFTFIQAQKSQTPMQEWNGDL